MARWIARATLISLALILALALRPLAALGGVWTGVLPNLALGALFAALALAAEQIVRAGTPWTAAGTVAGVLVGGLLASILSRLLPEGTSSFSARELRPFVYLVVVYAAAVVGARLATVLQGENLAAFFGKAAVAEASDYKIVDTSVIIDGRIADVCETGFLEGVFVVPSFVLRELQYIADAADPLRRARGRKGLETLQKLKKSPSLKVLFSEEEVPEARDVDLKLIELARRMGAKLLTNDYNLNKVASIRGVEVLNLNDLANSLKPVVLPGESLKVAIIREGKESHQGVAYLDDGTMVVVEHARAAIGRTVDVVVTSVLQTTAGKMFFGKLVGPEAQPVGSAARNGGGSSAEPLGAPAEKT